MSGQSEASFFIQDSRRAQQLRSRAVAGRVERLFSVRVALSARAAAPAAGPQQQDGGEWVALSALNGSNTEKAKKYILSLCVPEEVQECRTDQQLVEQLLSETSKLRDNLEVQFQTAILPASSPGCVRVQGYKSSVQKTVAKIHVAMVPPQQDAFPQPELRPPPLDSPPTPQSRHSPPTTAGAFSPSPPPPVSTDDTEQQQRSRVTPHQLPNIPTPTSETRLGKEEILRMIASDVERDGHVVPRGADSSLREQAIQYFVSLNFPREKTEAVVNSMEVGAEYDDILQRLNALHVTARPMSGLSQSRPYTQNGEPILSSNATLRPIVIDGSNVAMRHGNGRVFSCRGIQIAVDWFRYRGHREITVFVPQWRRETPRAEYPITDQEILNQLEIESILTFTPSRRIGNKRIVCYDDRFIVSLASQTNGVIVSNDNFRDLAEEDDKWRKTIEHRLVMFTFVNDIFMVPEDPLGKHGPRLSQLLQMEPTTSPSKGAVPSDQTGPKVCPYGERCTFGRRCRFSHPEREGRIDSSILTSRSANTSPAPAERRHTSDIQKDSASSHDERLSPGSGPAGQPMSSPQKPRTSPSFPTQQDSKLYQPTPSELHRYSQPQQGYSQPARQGYQYLGIPVTSSGNTLSPPSLRASSNPSTPVGSGGTSYPSHTFPIANLSVGRPRNMTDKIQPSIPSGSTSTGGEDFLSIAHSPRPLVPSHQHPPPGLVPRGDYAPTPYPPVPAVQYHPSNPHDMYSSYQQPSSNYQHQPQQHHSAYHVHAHAYPPSSSYCMPGEAPHRQPSPVKNSHQSDYSTTPSGHIPPQTNTYHKHPSTDFPPENRAYAADGSSYPQDQRSTPLLHHQVGGYRGGGQMLPSGHSDYGPAHHPTGGDRPYLQPGPRAASMYGGIGARPHEKDLLDRFQSSQSSPELYRNTKFRPAPSGGNAVPGGGASNINWTLFKQAQARLPDQEARIMDAMQRHPNADLEQLVMIVQQSW